MWEPYNRWPGITYTTVRLLEEFSSGIRDFRGLYRSTFVLDGFPFCRQLDMYCVVEPGERALLIDTGHLDLCGLSAIDTVNSRLRVPYENMDVFLTHFHVDHAGSLMYCVTQGSKHAFYKTPESMNDEDAQVFLRRTASLDLTSTQMSQLVDYYAGDNDVVRDSASVHSETHGGEVLSYRNYNLEVISTPGHTLSHQCLFDRDRKILFAGDHVVDAPPGLIQLSEDQHLISRYLESLDAIRNFDLEVLLMSHHNPLFGAQAIDGFITVIQRRYDVLAQRVLGIVKELGRVSVRSAAEKAAAHYKGGLSGFPVYMRGRRISMMFGSLDYLCDLGLAARGEEDDGSFVYWAK